MAVNPSSDTDARQPLNRQRVLEAALALADEEGLKALTMRRLGQALGVEAMSLYNHVSNKDDILDGILDLVAAEIADPGSGEAWHSAMRARAISAHDALMRHPWSAMLWVSRRRIGPGRMAYIESVLAELRGAGFTGGLLDRAFHTLENHILGHALQALSFDMSAEEMADAGRSFLDWLPQEQYPELAEHVRHHLRNPGVDPEEFTFGLDLLLEGLERARLAAAS